MYFKVFFSDVTCLFLISMLISNFEGTAVLITQLIDVYDSLLS